MIKKIKKKIYFITDYASYYFPILECIEYGLYIIQLQQEYSGETEINITLPYLNWSTIKQQPLSIVKTYYHGQNVAYHKKLYDKIFMDNHISLMKSLRILSPLFIAVLTGVHYFSFGDNNTIPETSFRFKELGYRMFTNLNLDKIYSLTYNDFYDHSHHKCIRDILKEKRQQSYEMSVQEFSVKP